MKATAGLLGPPQVMPLALSLALWTRAYDFGAYDFGACDFEAYDFGALAADRRDARADASTAPRPSTGESLLVDLHCCFMQLQGMPDYLPNSRHAI